MCANNSSDMQSLLEIWDKIRERIDRLKNKSESQKLMEMATHEKRFRKFRARKANNSILCMIDGCGSPAIQSHTISENCYLSNIAIDGHLLRFEPRDNKLERRLVLCPVGIQDATVFKGYCSQHDNDIYVEIDKEPLKSIRGVLLQCLRVIDYSLYWESFACLYIQAGNEQISNETGIDVDKLCFNHRYRIIGEILNLQCIMQYEIESDQYKDFGYHFHLATYDNYEIHFERSSLKIPVAMYNYFTLSTGRMVYVIVLPAEEHTDLIMICNKDLDLGLRWQNMVRNPISILNFVESCMMMGENWVACPSVFNSMTEEKKRVITEDLMYYKCRTLCDGVDYDMSIFDDIRKNIISCMPDGDPQKAIEELKISQIPVRDINSMKEKFFSKLSNETFHY